MIWFGSSPRSDLSMVTFPQVLLSLHRFREVPYVQCVTRTNIFKKKIESPPQVRLTHVSDDSYKSCDVPAITLWRNPLDPIVSLERDKTASFLILDVVKESVLVSPEDSVDASHQYSCVASCFDVNPSHIGRKVRGYFLKNRTDLSGHVGSDEALLPDVVLLRFIE